MDIQESATVAILDRCRALAETGIDVIDVSGGDPDFPTPDHVISAAFEAMRAGATHYVGSRGLTVLLDAIAAKLARENHLPIESPRESIIVTPSAKFAIGVTLAGLVGADDEVLVLEPSWGSTDALIRLAGGTPVHVSLESAYEFRVDGRRLREALSPRTKAIVVNTPHNPTGRVLAREELTNIATVARDANLLVIADEIYEHILYDGAVHHSIGSFPEMFSRTITINGFSKTYAMTGWRLGYLAGPPRLLREILKVHQHLMTCVSPFIQMAGAAALSGPQTPVRAMVEEYRARRAYIVPALSALGVLICPWPEGAFYVFPRVTGAWERNSMQLAASLLENVHLAVTPGIAYGPTGEGHIRISFANSREKLASTLRRLEKFFGNSKTQR